MAGVQWSQTLITLPAAVAAGLVSLLYRYRGKGRPFGSGRAAVWALAVIATTGAAATALALGLPAAAAQLPPVTIGLLVPTLLCAGRTLGVESPVERAVWYPVGEAVARSERAGHGREARRTRHAAEQALLTMLGRAHDWGYTDLGTPVRSAASSTAGALSAPHPR